MKEENFCYWLKGYFEISDSKELSEQQVQIIKDHLDLVFGKVTPDRKIGNNPIGIHEINEITKLFKTPPEGTRYC